MALGPASIGTPVPSEACLLRGDGGGYRWSGARLSCREVLLALAGGLFLTLAHGLHYLVSNQHQYFLLGMRLADSDFIPRDWYTWQTTHYHFAFGYLLWLLGKLGPLWLTTIAVH